MSEVSEEVSHSEKSERSKRGLDRRTKSKKKHSVSTEPKPSSRKVNKA